VTNHAPAKQSFRANRTNSLNQGQESQVEICEPQGDPAVEIQTNWTNRRFGAGGATATLRRGDGGRAALRCVALRPRQLPTTHNLHYL